MKLPVVITSAEDYIFLKTLKHARVSGNPLVLWLRKNGQARLIIPREHVGSWLIWYENNVPRFVMMKNFYTLPNGIRLVLAAETLATSVSVEQISAQRIMQSAELWRKAVEYYAEQAKLTVNALEKLDKNDPDYAVKSRYYDYCRSMIQALSQPETRMRALIQYIQDTGIVFESVDPTALLSLAPSDSDMAHLESFFRYYFSAKLHEMQALLKVGKRSLKPLIIAGVILLTILLIVPLILGLLHR